MTDDEFDEEDDYGTDEDEDEDDVPRHQPAPGTSNQDPQECSSLPSPFLPLSSFETCD